MGESSQMNLEAAWRWGKQQLQAISESPALDAQSLLGEVIGKDRAYLLAHSEQRLLPEQAAHFTGWIERAARGEPLAYIIGRRAFFDRMFRVTPDVLIPRPETELLLEQALARLDPQATTEVADVGTGSGALAVTLAAHRPHAQVYALDTSPAALGIAEDNARAHGVAITFLHGHLLEPLGERGIMVGGVMANLPYIPTDEMRRLAVSRYEPHLALDGGADGLDLIRQLLAQAVDVCAANAWLLLEIGADQGAAVLELARQRLPNAVVTLLTDLAGLDRIVCIQLQ